MLNQTMNAGRAVEHYESGGWSELESFLQTLQPEEALKELNVLIGYLRFTKKDLEGIERATDLAQSHMGIASTPEVLSAWKAICYNRAAHFWRGWGEDDITITPDMESHAHPYAQKNFDLAVKLNKGAVAIARAEWLLGAFQWSNNDRPGARMRFETAADLIESGGDANEIKMMRAYAIALAGENPEPLLGELENMPDGKDYADQVRRAIEVLG